MRRKRSLRPVLLLLPLLAVFFIIPDFLIQFFLLLYLLVNLAAWLFSMVTRRLVVVKRNFSVTRLYRGESVNVELTIENRSPVTVHNLAVSDRHGEIFIRGQACAVFSLGPRKKTTLSYTLVPDRRGRYTLGPVDLSAADPFALFPWEKTPDCGAAVIVYPHVFALELPVDHGMPGGTIASADPAYEDITAFRSIREYLPGDDLKRVNWKISARLGNLFTMQYQSSLSISALILLNLVEDDYPLRYRHSSIEYAIQIAASLVYFCAERRQEAGLACWARRDGATVAVNFPAGKGPSYAVGILEELACVASVPEKKDTVDLLFNRTRKLPFASRVFYVGPPLSEERLARLAGLARHGIAPEFFLSVAAPQFKQRLENLGLPCHEPDETRINHAAS